MSVCCENVRVCIVTNSTHLSKFLSHLRSVVGARPFLVETAGVEKAGN